MRDTLKFFESPRRGGGGGNKEPALLPFYRCIARALMRGASRRGGYKRDADAAREVRRRLRREVRERAKANDISWATIVLSSLALARFPCSPGDSRLAAIISRLTLSLYLSRPAVTASPGPGEGMPYIQNIYPTHMSIERTKRGRVGEGVREGGGLKGEK